MRPSKGKEGTLLVAPLLAKVVHGGAVPLVWVIGIVLIVAGGRSSRVIFFLFFSLTASQNG